MIILLNSDFWTIVSSIGSILSGVFTILLFFVGISQIKKLVSSGELDLYYKLKQDFSSSESITLYNCIIGNDIIIHTDNNGRPYMMTNQNDFLSDELLNHLEDMDIFLQRKLIKKNTIIEGYGTIVERTWNSQLIQQYINLKRTFYQTETLHTGLEHLHTIINE